MEYFLLGGLILTAFISGYYAGAFWHTADTPAPRPKGASWWK